MERKVLVETSARHIHLTKEHIETLFGKGKELTIRNDLSQPGQFACHERIDLVGPKGTIENALILGPARKDTQIEISITDSRRLGITPPIRESGDIKDSVGIKLVGPEGEVDLKEGVIIAKRHVHLTPKVAKEFGLEDNEIVMLRIEGERALIFDEVVVRIREDFAPAVHLDTDEANAAACSGIVYGNLLKKPS